MNTNNLEDTLNYFLNSLEFDIAQSELRSIITKAFISGWLSRDETDAVLPSTKEP